MSLLPLFKEVCATTSAEIYKDADLKITITELFLSNVAISVRYRADIFGDKEQAVGDYITAHIQDANMLMGQVSEILVFGGYFDHSPEKDARMELHQAKAADCAKKVGAHVAQLIAIAETDTIPDCFIEMDEVAEPKKLLEKRAAGLADVASNLLISNDLCMQLADNLVTVASSLSTKMPSHAEMFRAEAENIKLFRQLCSFQREKIQDFANRMQPSPLL